MRKTALGGGGECFVVVIGVVELEECGYCY